MKDARNSDQESPTEAPTSTVQPAEGESGTTRGEASTPAADRPKPETTDVAPSQSEQ